MSHFSDKYHRPYFMGLAIIFVFLYHIWSFTANYDGVDIRIVKNLFGYGQFGVDIFFFLSTYGLSYSINRNSLKTFYSNRLRRIIPVYLFFLIICVGLFITTDIFKFCLYILASISGVASIYGDLCVEWYTPSLLMVYFCFPIINLISKWLAKLPVSALSMLFIILHAFLFYFDIGICEMLAYRIPIILLGCVCYHLDIQGDNKTIQMLSLLALFGILMFVGNIYRITLALPAVLYFVGNSIKLPLHRVIALLGTWSFEIYLAQVVTTKYFILWYKGDVVVQTIFVVGITILMALFFSFITKYIKKYLS